MKIHGLSLLAQQTSNWQLHHTKCFELLLLETGQLYKVALPANLVRMQDKAVASKDTAAVEVLNKLEA